MFVGNSEPSEMDVSKLYAAAKYQKRMISKKREIRNRHSTVTKRYDELVEDIRQTRAHRRSDVNRKLKQLEVLKNEKRRLKKINVAMSGTPNQYIERFGVPLLDILNSIIEAAKAAREFVGENLLKFLLDLFTTLYNIYQNPEWKGVILNLTNFFVRNFKQDHATLALEWFKQAFDIAFAQNEEGEKSYADYILSFFKMADSFIHDQLWKKISDFFCKIMTLYAAGKDMISIETLDFETVCSKFLEFKKNIPTITDIVEMAFEAYKFVAGHWKNICTGDWSIILLGKEETKIFEVETRELEQAFNFVLSGQEIELQNIYGMTLDKYESRLKKAIDDAKKLMHRTSSVQQRMCVSNFISKLTKMQSTLWARKADAPSKEEAYSIKMSGPSSCGKSTMIKLLSKTILKAYGRDPHEGGNVVFANIDEAYESTILPSHKIIVADDVANNKNTKPNYDRLLNYVNTVPRPLIKASADEKGMYYPGNDAMITTTNDETLRAMDCSVCPESILRRFNLDIEVKIRKRFRNNFGGLIKQPTLRFDVYKLVLKRFSHIESAGKNKAKSIEWEVIPRDVWNPHKDHKHDFSAMCAFVAKDIVRHRSVQKNQAGIQKQLDTCDFCDGCRCPKLICACLPTGPVEETDSISSDESSESEDSLSTCSDDSQDIPLLDFESFNTEEEDEIEERYRRSNRKRNEALDDVLHDISPDSLEELKKSPSIAEEKDLSRNIAMSGFTTYWQGLSTQELWDFRAALTSVNTSCMRNLRKSLLWYRLYNDREIYKQLLILMLVSGSACVVLGSQVARFACIATVLYGAHLYNRTINDIDLEISRRSDQLSCLCEDLTAHLEANAKKYFAISGSIFLAYGIYKSLKPFFLEGKSQDKSTFLDNATGWFANHLAKPKKGEHVFTLEDQRDYKEGYSRLPPKDTAVSRTTTSADLQKSIARSLRVVVTKSRGEVYGTVNGIMVASNVIMVPAHIVPYTFPFDIETTTTPGVPSAKTKDQKLTEDYCYIDRENDQAFIHLPSSPAGTDYSKFFPEEYPTFYSRSTVMLWKSPDNEVKVSRQAARPITTDVLYAGYLEHPGWLWGQQNKYTVLTLKQGTGLAYDTEFKGFGGLCGAMLIDADKGMIYGYHVAGQMDSHRGWCTCVTRPQITHALEQIRKTSPSLVVHSANHVRVDTYGLPYSIVNEKPHYLREDGTGAKTTVTYMGTVLKDGQHMESRARTPYMPTPFKGIEENLGARKHRPPKHPNDIEKGMKTLNKLTDPVQHYEADILKLAVDDYMEHTLTAIREDPEAADMLRIYTQEEALDGIGEFGLNGMPNDTSAGFPIQKSKKHCLVRDPMDETLVQIPREFNDEFDIQGEVDWTMNCWSEGLRSEPIYKASSKVNELLPEQKAREKVRKFYGSPIANFVASRRVLAGIPRIMKKHWKKTECMVGINPLSKEWAEFHTYLTEYSKKNMIAGDFSGFDTRMAAQITSAAAKIMVAWYREVGCSEDEIKLVEGALSDIIHPNILFDGNLFRFANGNPSGNLITVQLNSICNSIMMRYVYYAQMRNIKEKFADNVRLGTYGDDNAMSVKPHCSWYTHTSCQKEFEKLDIGYTMADKGAASRPYIGIEEISFLKRGFTHHKELDIVVAPIEEDSILKRFHWVKKPSESPLSFSEQFGAYTDGALREKYLHGREEYDAFIVKLKNIVVENPDLRGVISFIPYDEMTQILSPDYAATYVNKHTKLFAESCGVSADDLRMED